MYPSGHHEALPLQGAQPGQPVPYPGQPGGPPVVQHTVVNVIRESPRDHIIWSIFSLMNANPFCLGLAALIYSVKARDRKMVGDIEGARAYGSTACCLNTVAAVLTGLIVLPLIIWVVVSVIAFVHTLQMAAATSNNNYNRY